MATATTGTFLMIKNSSNWEKLVDIKNFPQLGGAPAQIDSSTLSDLVKVYVEGRQDSKQLEFKCNYEAADYDKIAGMRGETKEVAIWIGYKLESGEVVPDGNLGKFAGAGTLSVYLAGGEGDAIVEMVTTITQSKAFKKVA